MEDQPTQAEPRPATGSPEPRSTPSEPTGGIEAGDASGTDADAGTGAAGSPRPRRRRGGRGRGPRRPEGSEGSDTSSEAAGDADEASPGEETPAAGPAADEAGDAPKRKAPAQARSRARTKPPAKASEAKDDEGQTAGETSEADAGGETPEGAEGAESGAPKPRRRRRRGGRGRGGKKPSTEGDPEDTAGADEDATATAAAGDAESTPATRARRRRTSTAKGADEGGPEAKGKADAEAAEAAPSRRRRSGGSRGKSKDKETKGKEDAAEAPLSTRRTAAKSSRSTTRTRTTGGRRREALPLIRRVQDKVMVITEHGERDQIAVLEDRQLVQHYITRVGAHSMVGNIYMATVQNVLPGMEAAFLDIGRGRNAVLYAGEVNYDEEVEGGTPQRIEHVLKKNQAEMVQVTKDPIGGKGARLTAQISLPGRYLVLVPNSQVFGISRRLPDDERKRLRAAVKKAKPDHHGIIVRTAAEGASEEALQADVERLVAEWDAIAKKSKKAKAPSVIYEEPELTVRVVRDLFNGEEFKEMVTDSPRIYEIVTDYLRDIAPELLAKVRLHEGALPVFEEFHIVEQIHKALDRKVWLPSGGYLIIERTEALTVIDVNTGKHVGKTNLEETVVKTNLEAAEEVARQLRLRDIGGMIIIDFIDMLLEQNRKRVIQTLKDALAQDKTRSQVFDISPLGLLEMTRKRVSAGLLESFSETCPTCEGRGILLTLEV